jgi:uncharacterized protein (TIGR00251 family)
VEGLDIGLEGEAVNFRVRVSPRASRDAITGIHDGALKVSLTAPPVEGAANKALVALLSRKLGVPKSAVKITGGKRSKTKKVRVSGIDREALAGSLL